MLSTGGVFLEAVATGGVSLLGNSLSSLLSSDSLAASFSCRRLLFLVGLSGAAVLALANLVFLAIIRIDKIFSFNSNILCAERARQMKEDFRRANRSLFAPCDHRRQCIARSAHRLTFLCALKFKHRVQSHCKSSTARIARAT